MSLKSIPPMPGCYRIIHMLSGRCYIGSTHDLFKRFLEHREALNQRRHVNSWLQNTFAKAGPMAFRFQVLSIYHGKWKPDCLAPEEQRWMDQHERIFNRRPAGSDGYIAGAATLGRSKQRKAAGGPRTSPKAQPRPPGRCRGPRK